MNRDFKRKNRPFDISSSKRQKFRTTTKQQFEFHSTDQFSKDNEPFFILFEIKDSFLSLEQIK